MKSELYIYQGREHMLTEEQARILNYALALNRYTERYVKQPKPKNHGRKK